MTTPAQGNLSGSSSKAPDVAFEASGLSPEEAERLAATFKPSWEFDEAPFTQGSANGGIASAHIDSLAAGGIAHLGHGHGANTNGDSRLVAAHVPPQRVETHEPEVSVIIDRSITSAEMEAQRHAAPAPQSVRPPMAVVSPFAAPSFGSSGPSGQRVAPVMRGPRTADESLELPTSLKKSNKGLFIGLGVAVLAAALVLVVHGAMTSSDDAPPSNAANATAATGTAATAAAATAAPTPPAAPAPPSPDHRELERAASIPLPPPVVAAPTPPSPPPQRSASTAPRPQPHPAAPAPHRAAPRNPPKAAGGGIVRDVPF